MTNQKSLLKPSIELSTAALFWGFGFIATVWALESLAPAAIIFYRFTISFAVGLVALLISGVSMRSLKKEAIMASWAGIFLGMCLYLQTWGLEYTSATNSGFITTLYAVFVPLLERLFFKKKLSIWHGLCVVLAIIGTAMMLKVQTLELNAGDLLTLACAVAASLQIVYISWITPKSENAFAFNSFQSFWAGAPFLLLFPFSEGSWQLTEIRGTALWGMLSLTFGSTLLAFFLQIRAQRKMSSSLASLFFLLESPFACLFAIMILREQVSLFQGIGGALILFACALALWAENRTEMTAKVV